MIEFIDLRQYLPTYYDGIRDTNELMQVENRMHEETAENLRRVQDNFYIQTAREDGLAAYEKFYGIGVKPGQAFEERRFRVLTRIISQPPFTQLFLEERLSLLGADAKVTEYPQRYEVEIETNLTKRGQVDELPYLFAMMVPANLVVISKNRLEVNAEAELKMAHNAVYAITYTVSNDFNADYVVTGPARTGGSVQLWKEMAIQ